MSHVESVTIKCREFLFLASIVWNLAQCSVSRHQKKKRLQFPLTKIFMIANWFHSPMFAPFQHNISKIFSRIHGTLHDMKLIKSPKNSIFFTKYNSETGNRWYCWSCCRFVSRSTRWTWSFNLDTHKILTFSWQVPIIQTPCIIPIATFLIWEIL